MIIQFVPLNRILRFLANVDPIDVARATENLDPEVIIFNFKVYWFYKKNNGFYFLKKDYTCCGCLQDIYDS